MTRRTQPDTHHPWLITLAFLASALLLLVPAQAQEAEFEEKVDVEEVLLDVIVTDDGAVVVGLDKDDFVVTEDGERQEINSVSFYSHREYLDSTQRAEELGIDPNAVPTERYFILFFHDQRRLLPRLAARQLEAGNRSKQWVSQLSPNDYVAVVSYDAKLEIQQDFTNDKQALQDAIDLAVTGKDRNAELLDPSLTHPEPSLLAALPDDPKKVRDMTPRIYEGLQVIGEAVGHIPARKNLILFSLGFGEVDSFGFYQPDPRYYPPLRKALNDNNVAVYPTDLVPTSAFDRPFFNSPLRSALSNLANDTGGIYYYNFVNFVTPLEQISRDNAGYYLISYTASHPEGESGYQEVDVETTNEDFETRARRGYLYGEHED